MLLFAFNQTFAVFMGDNIEICEKSDFEDDSDEEDEKDEKEDDKVHSYESESNITSLNATKVTVEHLAISNGLLGQKVPYPPPDLL